MYFFVILSLLALNFTDLKFTVYDSDAFIPKNYATRQILLSRIAWPSVITAFTSVARGMAKNKPQKPHIPPNKSTAIIIATGCKLTTQRTAMAPAHCRQATE